MKHFEVKLHIKPTEIRYEGFHQSFNKFQNYTLIKSGDFEAESWKEAARTLTEIFGEDEILSMEITYEPTNEERSAGKRRKHYTIK